MSIIKRLRENMPKPASETIILAGVEVEVRQPGSIKVGDAYELSKEKAAEQMRNTRGVSGIERLKATPVDESINEARQREAENSGVELAPYESEYHRKLDALTNTIMVIEIAPYMLFDPETKELLFQSREERALLEELIQTGPELVGAISRGIRAYGESVNNAVQKKASKRSSKKGALPNG